MFDFNSFTIPAVGTAPTAPSAPKAEIKPLTEDDYLYTITDLEKEVIHWPAGNESPKVVLTLEVEGVTITHWKSWLHRTKIRVSAV